MYLGGWIAVIQRAPYEAQVTRQRQDSSERTVNRCVRRRSEEPHTAATAASLAAVSGERRSGRPSGVRPPSGRAAPAEWGLNSPDRAAPLPRVVGLLLPPHDVVGEGEVDHLVEPLLVLGMVDRGEHFDAPVEVAGHQIGRADQIAAVRRRLGRGRSGRYGCARGSARGCCGRGCSRTGPAHRRGRTGCRVRSCRSARRRRSPGTAPRRSRRRTPSWP